ncbi:N-acetylglucosamine kinase [Cognatiyoonia koreensis]|uniref:N-acetylglucosamine kinase n=1 Tax=Cognatiyoonia koreensis TaxID=364200 RepID=A0A1I0MQW2_9RHOB|nr:ROK family protein [Cognatiyoonia koreensis]SEV90978.1 N-acetylglucosamine kinase [Cognatiyoonia koreensis]
MTFAIGIDLGGSKIETQVFDNNWQVVAKRRVATPTAYDDLIAMLAAEIGWARGIAGADCPVGIGSAGLINRATGLALAANLPITGKAFPADIARSIGSPVHVLNDCRTLALSEAIFGAGHGHRSVAAIVMGTGVSSGLVINGDLVDGPTGTGGEIGHTSAPAHLVQQYGLSLEPCNCGRTGCIEQFVAGPGMARLALALTGHAADPVVIASDREGVFAPAWQAWNAFAGDLICNLVLTVDPDVIVLGGGLSRIAGVTESLSLAAQAAQIGEFAIPPIVLAAGGETSGARGAAYAATRSLA